MSSQYGFALAFLNSDPEISTLFKNAVKNTWTPDMFVAAAQHQVVPDQLRLGA
jgi:hypothetical protein